MPFHKKIFGSRKDVLKFVLELKITLVINLFFYQMWLLCVCFDEDEKLRRSKDYHCVSQLMQSV